MHCWSHGTEIISASQKGTHSLVRYPNWRPGAGGQWGLHSPVGPTGLQQTEKEFLESYTPQGTTRANNPGAQAFCNGGLLTNHCCSLRGRLLTVILSSDPGGWVLSLLSPSVMLQSTNVFFRGALQHLVPGFSVSCPSVCDCCPGDAP